LCVFIFNYLMTEILILLSSYYCRYLITSRRNSILQQWKCPGATKGTYVSHGLKNCILLTAGHYGGQTTTTHHQSRSHCLAKFASCYAVHLDLIGRLRSGVTLMCECFTLARTCTGYELGFPAFASRPPLYVDSECLGSCQRCGETLLPHSFIITTSESMLKYLTSLSPKNNFVKSGGNSPFPY
jgi:hypothetical protein